MSEAVTLAAKLAAVSAAVGAVGKTGRNEKQNFNFRGIDAVLNAAGPELRNAGIVVFPQVLSCDYEQVEVGQNRSLMGHVRVLVRYTFTDGSQEIAAIVAGEAMDSGDKATAKAMSVAFRTCLLQTLCLPTDEPDPDEHSYERAPRQTRQDAPGAAHDAPPQYEATPATDAQERALYAISKKLGKLPPAKGTLSKVEAGKRIEALQAQLEAKNAEPEEEPF